MIFQIENIVQSYFNKGTLEEVAVEELEHLVAEYPYLAPAQYFLAKKYIQTGHPDYKRQIAKTTLFFNNPHWLSLVLQDQVFNKNEFQENYVSKDEFQTTVISDQANAQQMPDNESSVYTEPVVDEKQEESTIAEYETPVFPDVAAETLLPKAEENTSAEIFSPHTERVESVEAEAASNVESIQDTTAASAIQQQEEGKEPIEAASPVAASPVADAEPVKVSADGVTTVVSEPLLKLPFEKIGLRLNELPADGNIPIEPLHTVDYFASQGIKLREIEGKDKLSVKLRSFTEWLKTMKRIHPEKLEGESEEQVQSKIQHIAEHSNEANEVVTEAMADVFARQGLNQKAIEVYQKLSLQNPDKRAYFAAKISKLNDH